MTTSNSILRPGQSSPTDHPAVALCIPIFHDKDEELLCAMLLAATSKQTAHTMFEAWSNWGPGRLLPLGAIIITMQRPVPADSLLVTCNALLLGATVGSAILPKALQRITAAARDAGIDGDYVPGRGMVTQRLLPACFDTNNNAQSADVPSYCSPRSSITCSDGHDPPDDPALPSGSAEVTATEAKVAKRAWVAVQDLSTLVYGDPALEALYMQQSVGRAAHFRHGMLVASFALAAWRCVAVASGPALAMAGMLLAALFLLAGTMATMLGRWCVHICCFKICIPKLPPQARS